MKKLYILRHSKAGQANKNILDDHERPLTPKGERLCRVVADEFRTQNIKPDLVVSSTAKRCLETYRAIAEHAALKVPIQTSSQLYLADPSELFRQLRKVDNANDSLLLVGHNPGVHEFCMQLTHRDSDRRLQKNLKNQFSPPTLAVFECEFDDWKKLKVNGALLTHYFRATEGRR